MATTKYLALRMQSRSVCAKSRRYQSAFAPENTKISFAPFSNRDLAVTNAMLKVCATPSVMKFGIKTLRKAFDRPNNPISRLLLWSVRKTVFKHYCAGETLADCSHLAQKMQKSSVNLIIDHSVEEREDESEWAHNLDQKRLLLSRAREELGEVVKFIPVKVTALSSPGMLGRISTQLRAHGDDWEDRPLCTEEVRANLSKEDRKLFDSAVSNLCALCEQAKSVGIPLLLDAEASPRQPAVDVIALELMKKFNKKGEKPFVYNTYQMYLKDASRRLARDAKSSAKNNIVFSAKVVRGAYLVQENSEASSENRSSPICETKDATDKQYDRAIYDMLSAVTRGEAAIVIATHNRTSVENAINTMRDLNIPNDHPNVYIAQILGICDHVTCALGVAKYNALKLVLFGDFYEIFPWLLRRLDENSDMMGAQMLESPLVKQELKRRLQHAQ